MIKEGKRQKGGVNRPPINKRPEAPKGQGISFMEDDPKWHAKWLDEKHEEELAIEKLK